MKKLHILFTLILIPGLGHVACTQDPEPPANSRSQSATATSIRYAPDPRRDNAGRCSGFVGKDGGLSEIGISEQLTYIRKEDAVICGKGDFNGDNVEDFFFSSPGGPYWRLRVVLLRGDGMILKSLPVKKGLSNPPEVYKSKEVPSDRNRELSLSLGRDEYGCPIPARDAIYAPGDGDETVYLIFNVSLGDFERFTCPSDRDQRDDEAELVQGEEESGVVQR